MPTPPPQSLHFTWDKHALYELCAQNPPRDARLLRAIHADAARSKPSPALTLGEDFCGTAALSRAWCDLSPRFRAVGIDIDKPTLARAQQLSTNHPNLKLIRADVLRPRDKADLIAVLNFSIGEIHTRPALIKYLRHARSRVRPKGCLICDLYGGSDAFETGLLDQTVKPPQFMQYPGGHAGANVAPAPPRPHPARNDRILYSWEQRSADPLTGEVVNAMHFDVRSKSKTVKPQVFLNAFIYHWRLWSIPELRDAMAEAGFKATQVYSRMADATDPEGNLYTRAIEDPADLGDSFNVFIVGS